VALKTDVAGANAKAPRRLLVPLAAAVDQLAGRITCEPPPAKPPPPKHEKQHGKHGHGGGNGQGEGGD
jgi:hypothetical protein